MIIYAPNVHCGGGLVLLQALLKCLPKGTTLFLDNRCPLLPSDLNRFNIFFVKPSLFHRIKSEFILEKNVSKDNIVLCFGNLPPLCHLPSKVVLFLQNRHLLENSLSSNLPFKLRARLTLERYWLRFFSRNVDQIVVQTSSMKRLVSRIFLKPVTVFPFCDIERNTINSSLKKVYDFVYVASGELHKNHKCLIDAWVILAEWDFFPSLCLTINSRDFISTASYIENKKNIFNLNIKNVGSLSSDDIRKLYQESDALIFPSVLESFGLPLIEAKHAGLKIIASELDYVRDILDPNESFSPDSPVSIARAVLRSLRKKEKKISILDANSFLQKIKEV